MDCLEMDCLEMDCLEMDCSYHYSYFNTIVPAHFEQYLAVFAIYYILIVVANWKIFTKAGKPGWASIIPIYNNIVLLQICGFSGWCIFLYFVPLVNIIFLCCQLYRLARAFGKGIIFTLGLAILNPIFTLILGFGDAKYLAESAQNAATTDSAAAREKKEIDDWVNGK